MGIWPIQCVGKAKRVLSVEMKVQYEVIAEDGLGGELMSCVDESISDQEDHSAESGCGSMMQRLT